MKHITTESRQAGMTLVEIMIALLIGAFLIGGILQIFLSTKQTYKMQEGLSRMQENGRFAMEFITRDIRMGDYWGCLGSGLANTTSVLRTTSSKYDPAIHDFSVGSGVAGTDGAAGANAALDGPDTITFKGAFDGGTPIVQAMVSVSADLKVPKGSAPNEFDIVVVSDCLSADIFEVTNDPSTGTGTEDQVLHNGGALAEGPGNFAPASLSKPYGLDARLFKINTTVYSIQNGAGGRPALFRKINGLADTELVEGIENMQILYGEDTDADGTPNYYETAGNVVNMNNVVSIRISLLLSSTDANLASQPLAFTYNGVTTNPAPVDQRIRRVFTSTIAVRNRLP